MAIIINSIFPIIILLVTGNLLRRYHFLSPEFWRGSEKLVYYILFPALLIHKISQVDLAHFPLFRMLSFLWILFAILSLLAFLIYKISHSQAFQFSSIYQAVTRFNSYIYFAIVAEFWGNSGLAIASVLTGLIVPTVNILCVASFSVNGDKFSLKKTLLSIGKNPLFLACITGFIINILPFNLPMFILGSLDIFARASLPLALLAVGAAVQVKSLYKVHIGFTPFPIWLAAITRLFIAPFICFMLAKLMGLSSEIAYSFTLAFAVPTATSAYILSKQLGGDAEMMATHISLQTLLSPISLFFWLSLFSYLR